MFEGNCIGQTKVSQRDTLECDHMVLVPVLLHLRTRIALVGELLGEALAHEYGQADIFVLPTWHETYGMVFTEAMSAGLPIVTTTAGAVPQTVPQSVGVLVPPGAVDALSFALDKVRDHDLRKEKALQSASQKLCSWQTAARELYGYLVVDKKIE